MPGEFTIFSNGIIGCEFNLHSSTSEEEIESKKPEFVLPPSSGKLLSVDEWNDQKAVNKFVQNLINANTMFGANTPNDLPSN